jgi:hypothetical protein
LQGITDTKEIPFPKRKRGNDKLIELRDKLYTGVWQLIFCSYTYVPHLTVGRLPHQELFLKAVATATRNYGYFETQVAKFVFLVFNRMAHANEFNAPIINTTATSQPQHNKRLSEKLGSSAIIRLFHNANYHIEIPMIAIPLSRAISEYDCAALCKF